MSNNNHEGSDLTTQPEKVVSEKSQENSEDLACLLEAAQKKTTENWDLFLRARADADNIRRRALLDVENAHKYGIEKFAREILAVVDSLDHGLAAANAVEGKEDKGLKEGILLTRKLLVDTLEKFGIHELNPLGESFDPMRHEALSMQINNELESNKVITVVQKGFTLFDRLLRPARVIVSRKEETQPKVNGEG